MEKYLIALDLDGTILYDFDSLSQTLCDFIQKLENMGHKIVIATGRPFRSSKFIYERFKLDTPIINYNGGLITHPLKKDFKIVNYTVSKDVIIDIFEKNIDNIRNAFSEVFDSIYLYKEEKAIEPLLHTGGSTGLIIGNLRHTLKTDPNGFIIIGKQGSGESIEKYINETYQGKVLCRIWNLSGEYDSIIEIFTPESNKGQGLEYVANYLGFDRSHIIAIGDGHNDIEMIEYAGIGVCVKNSHPDLLEKADIVLKHSASENAVYRFLNEFLLKK